MKVSRQVTHRTAGLPVQPFLYLLTLHSPQSFETLPILQQIQSWAAWILCILTANSCYKLLGVADCSGVSIIVPAYNAQKTLEDCMAR